MMSVTIFTLRALIHWPFSIVPVSISRSFTAFSVFRPRPDSISRSISMPIPRSSAFFIFRPRSFFIPWPRSSLFFRPRSSLRLSLLLLLLKRKQFSSLLIHFLLIFFKNGLSRFLNLLFSMIVPLFGYRLRKVTMYPPLIDQHPIHLKICLHTTLLLFILYKCIL